ncbi:MAG: hypothetical protein JWN52_2690 [Actinomycetia bacterium]|nr:hypothetical protein [Actinomycetes bacterium]
MTIHTTLPLAALTPGIVLMALGLYLVPHTRRPRATSA